MNEEPRAKHKIRACDNKKNTIELSKYSDRKLKMKIFLTQQK